MSSRVLSSERRDERFPGLLRGRHEAPARRHWIIGPAALLVPLWLECKASSRAAVAMALVPAVLSVLHYVMLPMAGRIGLLGLGTAAWLIAAMVLVERGIRSQGAAEVIPATIERCHTAKRAA